MNLLKRNLSLVSFVLLLCAVPNTYAVDPLEFKGLHIGATVEDLKAKYPGAIECRDPKQEAAKADYPGGKEHYEQLLILADVQCYVDWDYVRAHPTELDRFAGHKADEIEFNFIGNRLLYAYANLYPDGFDDVASALTAKYGRATKRSNEVIQNRLGARFINTKVSWKRAGATLELSRYTESLEYSRYSLAADNYDSVVEKRRAARAKEAGKSL